MSKRLWWGVAIQAIGDYLGKSRELTPLEIREAEMFLTDTYGSWAKSREFVCDNIDICPERLRKNAIRAKQEGKTLKEFMTIHKYPTKRRRK